MKTVTPYMESQLAFWLGAFTEWRPNFICWRNDTSADYCVGVVWHQVEADSMQAIEIHVGDDNQVRVLLHPAEPLKALGELLR